MADLHSHSLMQAGWHVVKSSYSPCFLVADGDECFSRHLSYRCCTQCRRTGTGDAFWVKQLLKRGVTTPSSQNPWKYMLAPLPPDAPTTNPKVVASGWIREYSCTQAKPVTTTINAVVM